MRNTRRWWLGFLIATLLVFVIGLVGRFTFFGYMWSSVGDQEIGVETVGGNVTRVLGPGIHSNTTFWADLYEVRVSQLPWCTSDSEVLTKDNQRLGFVVCGTVQRPGRFDFVDPDAPEKENFYEANNGQNWVSYKNYYTNDDLLAGAYHQEPSPDGKDQLYIIDKAGLMQQLAQQAMKACVGDRTFSEAVVGSARDSLRACIDEGTSTLAAAYGGMQVQNVTVPNVILGPEVQTKLDAITAEIYNTQLLRQEEQKALAESAKQLAVEQGAIKVSQGKAQEEARQKELTAQLQAKAEESRVRLIEAQKANEKREAELELQIAEIKLETAKLEAQQSNAWEVILADLLAEYPQYAEYLVMKAAVTGWKNVDKVILPAGVNPVTVINPWGGTTPFLLGTPTAPQPTPTVTP
jgi:regulator of protease activity HflC (stomatin/prohibitin superfamily)